MKLNDFCDLMESIAPASLAMQSDNVGLLVGTKREEIKTVLVALDCTTATVREAVEIGADLILTHHPLFFSPAKRILPCDPDLASVYALINNGVAMFAAHTNLDAAQGGINDCLAAELGLTDVIPLPPDNLGRVGNLKEPMRLIDFARFCEKKLDAVIRLCGDGDSIVRRVGMVGGGGGDDIAYGKASGADVFVTGEVRHHQALAAIESGIAVIEAGHYETERVVLLPLIKRLQSASHDVQYRLTYSEAACLRRV